MMVCFTVAFPHCIHRRGLASIDNRAAQPHMLKPYWVSTWFSHVDPSPTLPTAPWPCLSFRTQKSTRSIRASPALRRESYGMFQILALFRDRNISHLARKDFFSHVCNACLCPLCVCACVCMCVCVHVCVCGTYMYTYVAGICAE